MNDSDPISQIFFENNPRLQSGVSQSCKLKWLFPPFNIVSSHPVRLRAIIYIAYYRPFVITVLHQSFIYRSRPIEL